MTADADRDRARACPSTADVVQSSPMDATGIQERVAQINAFYAARRAERAADRADKPTRRRPDTVRHVCARCGWTWQTYAGDVPGACPACRARKWQTPPTPRISDTVRRCLHCGHEWRARKSDRPCACPACRARNWDRPPKFRRNAENGRDSTAEKAGKAV